MATLTTSWQNIANKSWVPGTGFSITWYLDAKYSTQSVANNTTTIQTRLRSVVNAGSGSGKNYKFTCSYANTVSGSSLWTFGTETITSGSGTITHNADGTKSITLSATAVVSGVSMSISMSGTATMPKINRYATITSAQDFNDEGNPVLGYSNPAGNSVSTLQASIANADGSALYLDYRDIPKTGTSYTFNLTDAERTILRTASKNSNSLTITFKVKTINGGTTFYQQVQKTMTIVNATPTYSYTKQEMNSVVSSRIGESANTLVQNLSQVKFVISASPKKNATISKIELTHAGITYTGSTNTITPTQILSSKANFTIKITDSRGNINTTGTTISINAIQYAPVKINSFSFKRQNPTSSNIKVNLNAVYWNTNIGSTTNAPVVKWKMDNGSWSEIPSSYVTTDNTNHRITVSDYPLNNQLVYTSGATFYISVNDAYTSTSNNVLVTKGIPVLDLGDDEVEVNGTFKATSNITSNGNIISKTVNVLEKIQSKPRASLTDANIAHAYENSCAHLQLVLATSSMTSNKPTNGDGFILHNSWDNSGQYVGQLYIPNSSSANKLQYRGCTNGTWGSWQDIPFASQIPIISTTTSSNVTRTSFKFPSGLLINTVKYPYTSVGCNTAWGGTYASTTQYPGNYQTAFTTLFSVNLSARPTTGNHWSMLVETSESLTQAPPFQLLRGTKSNVSGWALITAIGLWK